MRSSLLFRGSLTVVSLLAALLAEGSALVACAPAETGTTTVTAADLSIPSGREPHDARVLQAFGEAPEGQLACRSKSLADGTVELYLDWKGSEARGTLVREAPSGMLTVQKVHAQRYKGMIIADDTLSQDLVVHAATLSDKDGKSYIRLGDSKQSWVACQ